MLISPSLHHHFFITITSDNNESEYFSETLAAESLPHYQASPSPVKESPTTSPYSSVDATNYVNNNGQQYQQHTPAAAAAVAAPAPQSNLINNNPKYHQPPTYNNNTQTNGNGPPQLVRNNVVMSASIPSGGVSASSQMQQQLQQKYYDQYENYARPNPSSNGNGVNGNGMSVNQQQNGMSQSVYNGNKAYAGHPQQMTASYNQQMAYNNHYNNHQNGSGVGKIADYDPVTDGPRNVPQTARPNQTLIYSSDRAAREYSDSLYSCFVSFVLFLAHQITFVRLRIVQNQHWQ